MSWNEQGSTILQYLIRSVIENVIANKERNCWGPGQDFQARNQKSKRIARKGSRISHITTDVGRFMLLLKI